MSAMIQLRCVAVYRHRLRLLRHLLPTFSRWLQHVSCQQQSVQSSYARSSFISMHDINHCPLNPIVSHCEQHRTYCPLQSHHSIVAVCPASLQAFSRPLHSCRTLARHPRPADPDYDVIFRFPHIRAVRMLCRLKLYQTGLTLAAVPVVAVTQDAQAAAVVVGIGSLAACMLYVMGEFFRRFVGLLYLKRDGQLLKVAHLTFWGGRRDQLIPVGDVVPFAELKDSPGDVYFRLRRYSRADVFYVSLRYGDVVSRGKLEAVFGPVSDR